jgi:hypothetical protein
LNTWTGWGVNAIEGDWSLFDELVREVLAPGSPEGYEYILNWAAYMFQKPTERPEVALAFRGEKGAGKSTFGRIMSMLVGRSHSKSPKEVGKQFDAFLDNCLLMFLDEAVKPRRGNDTAQMNRIITEPTLMVEPKGLEQRTIDNFIHVIIASNDQWFVSASARDERRYYVSEVSTKYQGNKDNFFGRLDKQMENGGYEALLYHLMHRDISTFDPRQYPQTDALRDQQLLALDEFDRWLLEWLNDYEKADPWFPMEDEGAWQNSEEEEAEYMVSKNMVVAHFKDWCEREKIHPTTLHKLLGHRS